MIVLRVLFGPTVSHSLAVVLGLHGQIVWKSLLMCRMPQSSEAF